MAWPRGHVVQAIVLRCASSSTVKHALLVVNQQAFREFSIYREKLVYSYRVYVYIYIYIYIYT